LTFIVLTPYEEGLPACKIVVVTSTRREGDWPTWTRVATWSRKLYMGPLSLKEVKSLKSAVNLDLSDEDIDNSFRQFGGSARLLFSNPEGAKQKVDEAFVTLRTFKGKSGSEESLFEAASTLL
jgi:hypothetical protein